MDIGRRLHFKKKAKVIFMKRIKLFSAAFICLLMIASCDFIVKNVNIDDQFDDVSDGGGSGGGGNEGGNGNGNGGQINWNAAQITITTEAHLREFARLVNNGTNNFNGRTVTLGNNIDLKNGNWIAIGSNNARTFEGVFNGNGKVVSGVRINSSGDNQGFFATIGENATIKNLGLTVDITGGGQVGGLVGQFRSGAIRNCYAVGSVGGNNNVGGLVGYTTYGTIENCYFIGDVSIDGNNPLVGGLVGQAYSGIVSSYASGNVVGNKLVGSSTTGTMCWNSAMKSESEMRDPNTFVDWDFVNIWDINPNINNGFPYLR